MWPPSNPTKLSLSQGSVGASVSKGGAWNSKECERRARVLSTTGSTKRGRSRCTGANATTTATANANRMQVRVVTDFRAREGRERQPGGFRASSGWVVLQNKQVAKGLTGQRGTVCDRRQFVLQRRLKEFVSRVQMLGDAQLVVRCDGSPK